MIKSNKFKQRWLPLTFVPLFSVMILAGCGSDDDDGGGGDASGDDVEEMDSGDNGGTDPTDTSGGDADGNGVPDAFETTDPAADQNGNGIADEFETAADGTLSDTNGNGVDDSFEAALTGGTDANGDGVDDAAVEDGDAGGGDAPIDQTGPLNEIPIGNSGIAALSWDGTTLSGQVDVEDDVSATGAGLYTGIAASGFAQPAVTLNGGPTFFVPTGLAEDMSAVIADNIVSGNLFVRINLADGGFENGIVLLNGVEPNFAEMSAENSVPAGDFFSNGAGFINVNTVTGDFTAVVNTNVNPADLDADGNPETVSMVHIHSGAADENGPVIVVFEDVSGGGSTWTANGVLSAEDLEMVLAGDSYFNAHRTDGTNFFRGQIPGF